MAAVIPYPAYKDSGVPWLGEIPAHWEALRLRNAVEMRVSNVDKLTKEGELPVRLCNYVNVYKNDRIIERLAFMRATATPEELERFRLQAGDVLITKDSEMWNDIGVPALVEYIAPDLICGYHLALLRPRRGYTMGDYLLRALQSLGVAYQFHVAANGVTRYGLSHDAIKTVLLPIPPLPEQTAIVRYLDHMDRRIRRYIRAKQKLIALLNEQKQAIIHQAVTRGLDPNVRLKPSGVEWLGDVPEHWGVRKLAQIAKIFNGTTPSRMQPKYWRDGTIPWLSSGKVNDYVVHAPSELISETALRECSLSVVPRGSVILGMIGQGKTRGTSARLEIDACINQNLAAIVPKHELDGRFLHHMLTAFYGPIRGGGRGGNQEALNCEIISSLRLPLPSLAEQHSVVDHLESRLSGLVEILQNTQRQIALVREYRARLIADVVTGKFDVRDAAAALPDEVEEIIPIEDQDADTDVVGEESEATDDVEGE